MNSTTEPGLERTKAETGWLRSAVYVAYALAFLVLLVALGRRQETWRAALPAADVLADQLAALDNLPTDERARIETLHTALAETSPDTQQRRDSAERYLAWLDTLSPADQARLLETPPEERLPIVRTLMEKQGQELARWRLAANARFRPSSLRRLRPPPESIVRRLRRQVPIDQLTPRERELLDEMPSPEVIFYIGALLAKYAVSTEGDSRVGELMNGLYQIAPRVNELFGARSYRELRPEMRERFHRLVVAVFLLPTLPEAELLEYLDTQPTLANEPVWFRDELSHDVFWRGVTLRYYLDHPDRIPEDCRADLEDLLRGRERYRGEVPP